jgi:hypothetical protein
MADHVDQNESPATFDFISDEKFRNSLRNDYGEIVRCMGSGAWKAVHVLAGSIVETVLVDYLVATNHHKVKGKDPLKMELAEVIEACRKDGVLSQRASDLSSVIRSYRNLIHPGRVIRLGEKIDLKTATVAKTLVDVVLEEIVAAKADKYGFTAEQIVNKVEKDSSAVSVLSHFLKDTNEFERERLLLDVIPKRYFNTDFNNPFEEFFVDHLEKVFRQTFDTLPDEKKAVVTKRFVKILKEESEEVVFKYQIGFFKASDLKYLNGSDASLVKTHLLSRLRTELESKELLDVMVGIGGFLEPDEIGPLMDSIMRMMAYSKSERLRKRASTALIDLFYEIPEGPDEKMKKRLDEWIALLKRKELTEPLREAEILKNIMDNRNEELPF